MLHTSDRESVALPLGVKLGTPPRWLRRKERPAMPFAPAAVALSEPPRLKREEAIDSMPAHLRRSLPSGLAEARRRLNFYSPPSR